MANPAAEARARLLAAHPEAVVSERRRNSIKHCLADAPDGKRRFALDAFIGPIHYGLGEDQEIDTAFEPAAAPWSWEMTKADFEVRALSRLNAGQVVEYRDGAEWVRFQPMALQYSNALDQIQPISMPGQVDAEVGDDTLTWADGYGPGIDISWQAQTARLAKRLTIQSPSALPPVQQYILNGGEPCLELNFIFAYSSGVTPWVNGKAWDGKAQAETQGLVEFRDGEGNVLWWFNLPRSWDAEDEQQLGTFRFKKVGNSLYVSHRIPLGFVQGAAYPLVMDVDVDKQVGASADDVMCVRNNGDHTFGTDGITVNVGYTGSTTQKQGGAFRFTTVGVPQGSTVDVAYLRVYSHWERLNETVNSRLYCHAHDDSTQIVDDADLHGRTPTTKVDWDNIPAWDADTWYNSLSIVTPVQEVVNRALWNQGAMNVYWEDFEGRSTAAATRIRQAKSWDDDTALAAKLHIEYSGGAPEAIASLRLLRGVGR